VGRRLRRRKGRKKHQEKAKDAVLVNVCIITTQVLTRTDWERLLCSKYACHDENTRQILSIKVNESGMSTDPTDSQVGYDMKVWTLLDGQLTVDTADNHQQINFNSNIYM